MRNMFLIGASVLALGISSAASAPLVDVDDNGDNNSSDIEQTAGSTNSSIMVIQDQDGSDAPDVGSATGGLNVFIRQTIDPASTDASTIIVDQADTGGLGGGNAASVVQDVNVLSTIDVSQDGKKNKADVDQMGDSQTADIMQTGKRNEALLLQEQSGNMAMITQNGDDNFADVDQLGIDGVVMVMQDGNDNQATATQTASIASGAKIDVFQDGNNGSTTIVQN